PVTPSLIVGLNKWLPNSLSASAASRICSKNSSTIKASVCRPQRRAKEHDPYSENDRRLKRIETAPGASNRHPVAVGCERSTDDLPHANGPSWSTTRNLRTVNSSTSSTPHRALLIARPPNARRAMANAPMATAPNAAAPNASANRLVAGTVLDCRITSRAMCDLHRLGPVPGTSRISLSADEHFAIPRDGGEMQRQCMTRMGRLVAATANF